MVQEHFIDISKSLTTEEAISGLDGSIAVVGNATPTKKMGGILDDFDHVIRFNRFKIAGYELLIGRKTSIWCTFGDRAEIVNPWAVSPFQKNAPETVDPNGLNMIYAENDVHKIMDIEYPTTGAALLALFHYIKKPVCAFCFDFLESPDYFKPEIPQDKSVHAIFLDKEKMFIKNSEYIRLIT